MSVQHPAAVWAGWFPDADHSAKICRYCYTVQGNVPPLRGGNAQHKIDCGASAADDANMTNTSEEPNIVMFLSELLLLPVSGKCQ